MTEPAEALVRLLAAARGDRPQSLACKEAEEVLNIALAVLVELAVSNDRIDRLERMVAEVRGVTVDALREVTYSGAAAHERSAATEALLIRGLRILLDPRNGAATTG